LIVGFIILFFLDKKFREFNLIHWWLIFFGALIGALPDLIGIYGNYILYDNWNLYLSAHSGSIYNILRYTIIYTIHPYLDTFMHGEGKEWWIWNQRLWLEIVIILINAIGIYYFFKWKAKIKEYGI